MSLSGFPQKPPSTSFQGPRGHHPAVHFPAKVSPEARLYVSYRNAAAFRAVPVQKFEPPRTKYPFRALSRLSSDITFWTTADEGKGRLISNQNGPTGLSLAQLLMHNLAQGSTWVERSNDFCPFAEKTPFIQSRVFLE
jgi:hypothetical protein